MKGQGSMIIDKRQQGAAKYSIKNMIGIYSEKIKSPLCFCGQYVTLDLSRIVLFSRISTRFLMGFVCRNNTTVKHPSE